MRRILIALLFVFLITALCACSSEMIDYHANKNNISDNYSQFVDETDENGEAYEGFDILSSNDPYLFNSEEELSTVIQLRECDDEVLLSLTKYYRPKTLVSDLVLSAIYVKDAYVALRYDYRTIANSECNQEMYFLLEWYRELKTQNLQDELSRVFLPGVVKQIDEYYIIEAGELQDVFWEQEGNVFHAVTPTSISLSQLRAFCEIEMVPIQHQEQ